MAKKAASAVVHEADKPPTRPLKYSDDRYLAATGKNWEYWMKELKKAGAENMPHKEIAVLLEKKYGVSPWWCQSITVRFEQETGRRIPGETSDSTYQATITKTVSGNAEEIFSAWASKFSLAKTYNGSKVKDGPSTSITSKWHYWRVKLADGSSVSINFSQKDRNKVLVQVSHDKLLSLEEISSSKDFWKKKLDGFME